MNDFNQISNRVRCILVTAMMILPGGAWAQTAGVASINLGSTQTDTATNQGAGFIFSATQPNVEITSLGRYMLSGNNGIHQLTLLQTPSPYETNPFNATVIATASLNMSVGNPDGQGFKYATLSSPVILDPSQYYILVSNEGPAGTAPNGDPFYSAANTTISSMASGFSSIEGAYTPAGGGVASLNNVVSITEVQEASATYGPLNFKYTTPGVLNVCNYGVVGDGHTDNTTALRNFFNTTVPSYNVGGPQDDEAVVEVYFPAGTYYIDDMIQLPSYLVLVGAPGAVIKQTNSSSDIFYLNGFRTSIQGLTFTGGKRALKIYTGDVDTTTTFINNCTFQNAGSYAVDCTYRLNAQGQPCDYYTWNSNSNPPAWVYTSDDPNGSYSYNSTLLHLKNCSFTNCMTALRTNADCCVLEDSTISTPTTMTGAEIISAGLLRLENITGTSNVTNATGLRWIDFIFGDLALRNVSLTGNNGTDLCPVYAYNQFHSANGSIQSSIVLENSNFDASRCPKQAVIYCLQEPNQITVRGCVESTGMTTNIFAFQTVPTSSYFSGMDAPWECAYTVSANTYLTNNLPSAMQTYARNPAPAAVDTFVGNTLIGKKDNFLSPASFTVSNRLNVLDYGAVGDNRTNNAPALNAVFAAAANLSNPEVIFPAGVYLIESTVTIPNNVVICGIGKSAISVPSGATFDLLAATSATNIAIENMNLSGGGRALNLAVKPGNSDQILVDYCTFYNNTGASIQCLNPSLVVDSSPLTKLRVTDCLFYNDTQVVVSNVNALVDSNWISTVIISSGQPQPSNMAAMDNMGTMVFQNITGVPMDSTKVNNYRWIDNYGSLLCDFVRFGGESGGIPNLVMFNHAGNASNAVLQDGWILGTYATPRPSPIGVDQLPSLLALRSNTGDEDPNIPHTTTVNAVAPRTAMNGLLYYSGNTVQEDSAYPNGWTLPLATDHPNEGSGGTTQLYYRFETGNPLGDSSSFQRNLTTLFGGGVVQAPGLLNPIPLTGASNVSALVLTGNDSSPQYAQRSTGYTPPGSLTLECLYQLDVSSVTEPKAIAGEYHWSASADSYAFYLNPDLTVKFMVSHDGVNCVTCSTAPIVPGHNYYLAGVFYASSGQAELYIKDLTVGTPLIFCDFQTFGGATTPYQTTLPFNIGCTETGDNCVAETIDEVRVSSEALPWYNTPGAFLLPSYTVTSSSGANGTLIPGTQICAKGKSVTFTATPDPGHSVSVWKVDGSSAQTGGTTYTLSSISANHTVSVVFQ